MTMCVCITVPLEIRLEKSEDWLQTYDYKIIN